MYRQASGNPSSPGYVPLLEHGQSTIVVESDVVTKYIAQHVGISSNETDEGSGSSSTKMYPCKSTDKDSHEKIENFLRLWDIITDDYYNVLTATSLDDVHACEEIFWSSLRMIEDDIFAAPHRAATTVTATDGGGGGGGDTNEIDEPYFVLENTFSVAECIAGPWIQRFFVTLPYFRGIDVHDEMKKEKRNLEKTLQWMIGVCQRSSVIQSKCPNEEMLNAAKRYYVSYISPTAPGTL